MSEQRHPWLELIGLALSVVFAAGLGLYSFIRATSTPLHRHPQAVPSVAKSTPLPRWADAVTEAQQIARAGVIEQNLPGLSAAVAVDGAIVWAEGFGWADIEKQVPVAPRTRFRIGHASKALTSVAVGLLLEKHKMHLDDEIQTLRPRLDARHRVARGRTGAVGGACQPNHRGRLHVVPHLPRQRDRRCRDGEPVVPEREVDCGEHCAGLRTSEASSEPVATVTPASEAGIEG